MGITNITEVDVLETVVEQLSRKDGYTADNYFQDGEGKWLLRPGERVGACCAIGGVEQAIWKLTNEVVTSERVSAAYRGRPDNRRYVSRLYARVMRRLNGVAMRSPVAKSFDPEGCPIEQLTFVRQKPTVLKYFRMALEEARAEAA